MSVDELIAELAKYPGDTLVVYDDAHFGPVQATKVVQGRFEYNRWRFEYNISGLSDTFKPRVDGQYMECNSVCIR